MGEIASSLSNNIVKIFTCSCVTSGPLIKFTQAPEGLESLTNLAYPAEDRQGCLFGRKQILKSVLRMLELRRYAVDGVGVSNHSLEIVLTDSGWRFSILVLGARGLRNF